MSHSLSPRLHNYWIKKYQLLEYFYEAISVKPEDLNNTLHGLIKLNFAGVNITIPHKERALSLIDSADEIALRIGAVNTIIIKDRKLLGTNTDAYGFITSLKAKMPDFSAGRAFVIGAGGAARAICIGLLDEGFEVVLMNRTNEKAEKIKSFFGHKNLETIPWSDIPRLETISLLVNSTSLGMKGQPSLDISLETLPEKAWVSDIVYAAETTENAANFYDPTITDLLARSELRGNKVVSGLWMLLYQAQSAFEAWFGIKPEVTDELYRYMLEAL